MPDSHAFPPCGLIVHRPGDEAETLLAAFAAEIADGPLRVGGIYQVTETVANAKNRMWVVDLQTGRRISISQALGSGSDSCCLDAAGLAEASMVLRRAIADRVDLLIVNKFAANEVDGRGLAGEIFQALAEGIPVLTLVAERHLEGWRALSGGGLGDPLEPRMKALRAWAGRLTPSRRPEDAPPPPNPRAG
jgi:nucleoside-triphosphatase THEP1